MHFTIFSALNIIERQFEVKCAMSRADITKEELVDLFCVQKLTIKQVAARLDVSEKTVWNYKKAYNIDARLWWKYQKIYCPECGIEIDPEVKLEEKTRKRLIKNGHVLCKKCKIEDRRKKDRERKALYRKDNRDEYNNYMRDLMRKKKAEE